MTAHYAFGQYEDDPIIKHRLLTRTTTTRGEPPLKKLQKKFTSFALEIEKDAENYGDCERLAKAFLQELTTFELPLLKSKAVVDANLREKENFDELRDEINRQILQAQDDIEDLKKQLEDSKIERHHKEECETIRKLIATQPPRSETQKVITELEKEIALLEAENIAGSRTLELRKKQFALLLHVVCTNVHKLHFFWVKRKNDIGRNRVGLFDFASPFICKTRLTTPPVLFINRLCFLHMGNLKELRLGGGGGHVSQKDYFKKIRHCLPICRNSLRFPQMRRTNYDDRENMEQV